MKIKEEDEPSEMKILNINNTNQRVIIIDDNRAIHEDFQKILASSPGKTNTHLQDLKASLFKKTQTQDTHTTFELSSAYQGQEGLTMVQQAIADRQPFALAFVDMRMPPGWDGLETIGHLWKADPNLQVVISSAYSDYNWDEIVKYLGTTDNLLILKKPFDTMEVLQFAHALTKKWSLRHETHMLLQSLEHKVLERTQELVQAKENLEQEIKQREQMEAELRLAQKLESLGQLAAGIAHEINTPTQFIGDNTQFLQEAFTDLQPLLKSFQTSRYQGKVSNWPEHLTAQIEGLDLPYLLEEIPRAIQESLDGIHRVAEIIKSMKEFCHPGSTGQENSDLNQLITNAVTVCRNEWKYVATLDLQLAPNLPLVPCFPGEFGQAILNMVINAAHAIASANDDGTLGCITITTRPLDEMVEVSIADTGTGIPKAIADKIYDPFFTTKEVGRGTGQGLAIAHSLIVDKLHGDIHYQTEEGKGTTFYLTLPIKKITLDKAQENHLNEKFDVFTGDKEATIATMS